MRREGKRWYGFVCPFIPLSENATKGVYVGRKGEVQRRYWKCPVLFISFLAHWTLCLRHVPRIGQEAGSHWLGIRFAGTLILHFTASRIVRDEYL